MISDSRQRWPDALQRGGRRFGALQIFWKNATRHTHCRALLQRSALCAGLFSSVVARCPAQEMAGHLGNQPTPHAVEEFSSQPNLISPLPFPISPVETPDIWLMQISPDLSPQEDLDAASELGRAASPPALSASTSPDASIASQVGADVEHVRSIVRSGGFSAGRSGPSITQAIGISNEITLAAAFRTETELFDSAPEIRPVAASVVKSGENEFAIDLPPAPLEETDHPLPINLGAALRLADARPLMVTAAQARAWVAEAQLQHAQIIWVPTLNASIVYFRHDGVGPDFNGGRNPVPYNPLSPRIPIYQEINYFYTGGGLNAVFALTDAIFEPLSSRQVVDSRRWDIQTAKNDALLTATTAYFNVQRARGTYAAALDVVKRGKSLVTELDALSHDLIPKVEVDRARQFLAGIEQEAALARQAWRVSSADLTQILRLDPRVVACPLEPDHLQITLVDPSRPLDELMPIALRSRPELSSQRANIQAAAVRIRQEKLRPFIPTVLITGFQTPAGMTTQFGFFGTGRNSKLNNWSWRDDVSLQVVWQAEGFGFGNLARVKKQRSEESFAIQQLYQMQDQISEEINAAQARAQSASVRVIQAERSLQQALVTYNGNYEGLHHTSRFGNFLEQVYRPQEVVAALENLWESYTEYFQTVADYNTAQFELFHALGYPARDIELLQPPGDPIPVDMERPAYLPHVDIGPPPATR